MRSSRVAIPIVETIHLLAIAMAVGTIMVIDLSVLGLALRREAVPRMARELSAFTWTGFAVALATGIALFGSEAVKLAPKPVFWIKLALLAVAFLFHLTAHRSLVTLPVSLESARARLTAAMSLALWFGVAFGGKAVGLFA
jgi:hypothetical protein